MAAIQPCALLLLVGQDWRIETVSANAAMLGDARPAALVGQPLAELIGSQAIHSLRNRMAWLSREESEVHDFGVQWGGVTFDVRAIRGEDKYLVEAELSVEPRLPDGIGLVRSMTDRLISANPIEMAEQAMRQLCSLTGFDRVILCDRNGFGIATAERNQRPGLDKWPAGAAVRVIADRDADPVPLLGCVNGDLLARAAFLAPDASERERLADLEIAAAMSLPLRIDRDLVGWVHTFHGSPRRSSAERRSVAHLFAERLVARMARHGWEC